MASGGGGGEGGDGNGPPPDDQGSEEYRESEGLFRGYLAERNDNDPARPLDQFLSDLRHESPATATGRHLARIAANVEAERREEMDQLIDFLNLTTDSALPSFEKVADRLISKGNINLGRILALLVFGYRISVRYLSGAMGNILATITRLFVQYIVKLGIVQWLKRNGQWGVQKVNEDPLFFAVVALAVATVAFVVWRNVAPHH